MTSSTQQEEFEEILEIMQKYELEAYIRADQHHPFYIVADAASTENLGWHMENYDAMLEIVGRIINEIKNEELREQLIADAIDLLRRMT